MHADPSVEAAAVPRRVAADGEAATLPLAPEVFRAVLGRFATGVTVVTAVQDGVDHAMTASAFASLSLDPLLVLVCVSQRARFHDAIAATPEWGVSVLAESGRAASAWFATKGRPLQGQLDRHPHSRGRLTGAALLHDALATLECRTWSTYDGGDHTILVGEVISLGLPQPGGRPLVYHHGRYHGLGPEI